MANDDLWDDLLQPTKKLEPGLFRLPARKNSATAKWLIGLRRRLLNVAGWTETEATDQEQSAGHSFKVASHSLIPREGSRT